MLGVPLQTSRNLMALRGYAAFAVMLGHLLYSPHYQMGFAQAEDWGWFGRLVLFHFLSVDVFFMLSGCVLVLGYWQRFDRSMPAKRIDSFIAKRLLRIYPLHLLATFWVGAYAYYGIAHPIASGQEDVIFNHWQWTGAINAMLMNGWGMVPISSWNEPSWTLSILFLLYILFPNFVLMFKRLPQVKLISLFIIVLLVVGYAVLRHYVPLGSHSDGMGAIIRGLVMFMIGMMLARLYQLKAGTTIRWNRTLFWTLAAMLVLMIAWWQIGAFDVWPLHALIALLIFSLLHAHGWLARRFANRVAVWLGIVSFSLYILHYPLLMGLNALAADDLAKLAGQGDAGLVAAYVLVLGAVLLVAKISYELIEVRLGRRLNRLMQPRR